MNNLNAESLIKAGRSLREPFQLTVHKDDGTVCQIGVLKILRLLPRRRIAAVAELDGRQILVKLFIGRFAGRYTRREVRGVKAIEAAGVLTPSLEWLGTLEAEGGKVVAFEFLGGARDLIDVWRESSEEERLLIMQGVISDLAKLHEGGVVQNDIHPENFLIQNGRIYTIDGGDVSRKRVDKLSEGKSLDNLALFVAQFHARHDNLMSKVLPVYESERHWQPKDSRLENLLSQVRKKRDIRKNDYVKKAFRECTRLSCVSRFRRFTVCERRYDSPEMQTMLNDLDSAIESGQLLKNGNTATVAKVNSPSGPLAIKRYNIKSSGHLLNRLFRKSRAWVSWGNTFRLEFLGIKTLKPVALVEERFGPFRGRAYFITEYEQGCDATTLAEKSNPDAEMRSIVEILRKLEEAGVSHGDLKASNFLLTGEGAAIIDLDSMTEHSLYRLKEQARIRDRARFMRNWTSAPVVEKRFADLLQAP
ncbi:MAG: hypothetical protein HOC70_12430 [Gammaproteobacteria bacterium]|jgi:tRNA A-37 threonylcarbamoyl transferase component Bud32|nr:hypothetical protein [Gammaproteobacteria bacterium]